jgi:hypothetical protein
VINGSAVTVTAVAGMILASLVIRDVYEGRPPQAEAAGAVIPAAEVSVRG